MTDSAILAVHAWPVAQQAAVARLKERGLAVISISTDALEVRDIARQKIRQAVTEMLALAYACPPGRLQLHSAPGQPPRVDIPGHCIGLSLSHEPGLSLAAIRDGGTVGVDLMRIDAALDWAPVAQLYLGTEACAEIGRQPPGQQAGHFAQAWTALEARLKCRSAAITEWNPELEHLLAQASLRRLELPPGFAGYTALGPASATE